MSRELERALDELEQATDRLALVLRTRFDSAPAAIERRGRAVARLRDLLNRSPHAATPAILERTRNESRRGDQLRLRLLLLQHTARSQMRQLANARALARTLDPAARPTTPTLNSTA